MTLQEILDREAIRDTLARYCHGVDRGDHKMILSAYHPGAYDDHGSYKGDVEGFVDFIVARFDEAPEIGQHHITSVLILLDGDRAKVLSYFLALNPGRPEAGGGHDLVGGRYLDDFEKRDGVWRIAHRVVVVDVTRDELSGSPLPSGSFTEGARHEGDPSVAFFEGWDAP